MHGQHAVMAAYTNATAAHHTSRVSHTTHLVPDACGVPLETCAPSASWPWWRIAPPPCTMLQKETSDQDIVDQCRCKNANTAMYPYRGRVAGTQPSASLLGLAPTLHDCESHSRRRVPGANSIVLSYSNVETFAHPRWYRASQAAGAAFGCRCCPTRLGWWFVVDARVRQRATIALSQW